MRVHYSTNQRTHKVLPTTATGMCLLQTSEGIGRGRPYSIRVGSATRDSPTHLSTAYSCDQDTQSNWYQKKQTSQTFRCFDWLVRFDELSDRSNNRTGRLEAGGGAVRRAWPVGLAAAEEVGEDEGGDGLDYYWGAEGEADIVAAGDIEGGLLAGADIEGGLGLGYAGGRLEGDTEDDRGAVRDAAVDSAGTVLGSGHDITFKFKRVIVFRAFHPGSGETVTELYASDSGNSEHGVGD